MKESITFFYLDDDTDDLSFFKEAAESIGYDAKVYRQAKSFFSAISSDQPTLVFVDYNMPNKNGCDIITEIRQNEKLGDLPLIVYSTASSPDTIKKCRECGADLYVTKPTSMASLQRALRFVANFDFGKKPVTEKDFLYLP